MNMSRQSQIKHRSRQYKSGLNSAVSGGIKFTRRLTLSDIDPFDQVIWDKRTALISTDKGEVIFKQEDVEFPSFWSGLASNIVASKYFRGPDLKGVRENSLKQVISRVVNTITRWGEKDKVFATTEDARIFEAELKAIVLHQFATFNSPVWFNVGIDEKPQASACFINSVEDTMDSIMRLATIEAQLFKGGSGTGTNFSTLRSSKESLSGGGKASGPVSFMKGFDAFAGVIKSGGKTRRAAKMVILNADHPDIVDFVKAKMIEEKKARCLIDCGYDGSISGEAYSSVFFQNSNNSVRVTDEFMEAVEKDRLWHTRAVTTGEIIDTMPARELFRLIAEVAHMCGDPGLQFDTTINRWHTCKNSGRINASNPCSEFMFLDNSSCNLASINLLKFLGEDGTFDAGLMKHVIDIMITAQEIIVDNAKYPTEEITATSRAFRPLGLGYANLGALLMARGYPYDSDEGRKYAKAVTALLTGEAYAQSARMAAMLGAFERFEENRDSMLEVIDLHMKALDCLSEENPPEEIFSAAQSAWNEARTLGERTGFRNAQVSVLAPTGTIGFMMDCDTTGIEPDISLVKYKSLVGGGVIRMINRTVDLALKNLGYENETIKKILNYIERKNMVEGCPEIKPQHLAVFDCALKPAGGTRVISPEGHLKMMIAVQPFISGAISKTVNLPFETTVQQIEEIFMGAWKGGVKAISIYRENSKGSQPVSTELPAKVTRSMRFESKPFRRRLPDERQSITHKFSIAGHEGYLIVGMFEDGSPGEIFIKMAREGSTLSGLMDSFALAISLTLQYGVPLKALVEKFSNTHFEPSGYTNNKEIPYAKSIMDYIFRYLASKFLPQESGGRGEGREENMDNFIGTSNSDGKISTGNDGQISIFKNPLDAPLCPNCGFIMVRNGSCYKCNNCGGTSGCS